MKKPFYQDEIIDLCDNNHFTVDEIFSLLKKKHSSIWRATIYRNVEDLVKNWYLRKLTNVGSKAVFEKNKWFHIHILDQKTWTLKDVEVDLNQLNIPLPEGFKVEDVEILVKGDLGI